MLIWIFKVDEFTCFYPVLFLVPDVLLWMLCLLSNPKTHRREVALPCHLLWLERRHLFCSSSSMQKFKYYAVITPDLEDGGYLVRFPDLEDVYTEGETLLGSFKHAEEVLKSMLEVMIDYNDKFNPPSPVSEITIVEGESLVAVEMSVTPKGQKVISIESL
ncbi:type II toxin-antitoxin system HicB family antitoxin [Exiguobacterium sp. R-17]|uniref:type II toxin-antitoxin system HicB family antitoxin n=1 Tax=Exiguobacterium sp. R-17 TaxID=3404054 RepID=UPI003CE85629